MGRCQTVFGDGEGSFGGQCRGSDDVSNRLEVPVAPVLGVLDAISQFRINGSHAIGEDRTAGRAGAALLVAAERKAHAGIACAVCHSLRIVNARSPGTLGKEDADEYHDAADDLGSAEHFAKSHPRDQDRQQWFGHADDGRL